MLCFKILNRVRIGSTTMDSLKTRNGTKGVNLEWKRSYKRWKIFKKNWMLIRYKITIMTFLNLLKIISMLTNDHPKVRNNNILFMICLIYSCWQHYRRLWRIGTIIATLKRKSKSLEKIPMYEMVSFHRGSTIPTSHIHMYDPDNITIAISIFRVSIIMCIKYCF